MINLDPTDNAALEAHLREAVVDARIEVTSWLGSQRLANLSPIAGAVKWDTTDRRGSLDLDIPTEAVVLHSEHPLAGVGQVLEASWVLPFIGVSVPIGRWLINEPTHIEGGLWQVRADPEGTARLARAQWWEPGTTAVTGFLGQQLGAMTMAANVAWQPSGPFPEVTLPATDCQPGDSILSSIEKLIEQTAVELRPDRRGAGVMLSRRVEQESPAADWQWSDDDRMIVKIEGVASDHLAPNRVTVWCEEDIEGTKTVRGWSEPLFMGPRRWDGPYGRVPRVVKLDNPATTEAMRLQARRMLREAQERAASVRVEMRADPRIEVGDTARIISQADGTDCFARVTSVALDAGSGLGVVEAAVVAGDIAGIPTNYHSIV